VAQILVGRRAYWILELRPLGRLAHSQSNFIAGDDIHGYPQCSSHKGSVLKCLFYSVVTFTGLQSVLSKVQSCFSPVPSSEYGCVSMGYDLFPESFIWPSFMTVFVYRSALSNHIHLEHRNQSSIIALLLLYGMFIYAGHVN
jgi:hypothetical protein